MDYWLMIIPILIFEAWYTADRKGLWRASKVAVSVFGQRVIRGNRGKCGQGKIYYLRSSKSKLQGWHSRQFGPQSNLSFKPILPRFWKHLFPQTLPNKPRLQTHVHKAAWSTCISTESEPPFVKLYLARVSLHLCYGSELIIFKLIRMIICIMIFICRSTTKVMLSLRGTTATPWGLQV